MLLLQQIINIVNAYYESVHPTFLQSGNVARDYIQSTNIIDRKIKINKNNNEDICNISDNIVAKDLLSFMNYFEPNNEILNIERPFLSDNMKQLFDNYYY